MLKFCNKVIEYCFYGLFFLTPLAFTSNTSELFEFNKMWMVFGFTIVIAAFWFIKMVIYKKTIFQRTPLDIPVLLFLLSQFISSIISLDSHTSFWGYYSRFNGGFFSILSYILLYYAFVTNLGTLIFVKRILKLSLISGLIVALWGLPSHFGYDPTCLIFRGNLDVACWTDAFQPKVRIFSTLGQPNWLAAYLAILIPISITFALRSIPSKIKKSISLHIIYYILYTILLFVDLLFTASRSGFLGLVIGLLFFFIASFYLVTFFKNIVYMKYLIIPFIILVIFSLFIGTPITPKITDFIKTSSQTIQPSVQTQNKPQGPALEVGGTESGTIRKIVWQGALEIWKNNPVFGTGVETFAFAYYKYRPTAHNMTSEWDYLYNKAHNEYLNYLATTGLFGLGSYLSIIGLFFFITFKEIKNHPFGELRAKMKNTIQNSKPQNNQLLSLSSGFDICILIFALLASYFSILVSNFFGFSVVLINLYFFLIPAFVFVLMGIIKPLSHNVIAITSEAREKQSQMGIASSYNPRNDANSKPSTLQWILVSLLILTTAYLILSLYRFWLADTSYALGYNLDRAGAYDQAYQKLKDAVDMRPGEPIFKDELSINNAVLAIAYATKKDATQAAVLAQQAIELSNQVVESHPQNIVFWKTRARLFYTLSQANNQYLTFALQALQSAHDLAPTDAKIAYNLGVLYGQTGNIQKGTEIIQQTIKLKPDYRDAYYALGLFYREQAIDKSGKVIKPELEQKAVETLKYILTHFNASDAAQKTLKDWGHVL